MKYASTYTDRGIEVVLTVLPLSAVPQFDPETPVQPNTFGVPDVVEIGWVRDAATGDFRPASAQEKRRLSIPVRVTEYQAKAALMNFGHFDKVQAYMDNPSAEPRVRLAWNTARDYERYDAKIYFIAREILKFPPETIEDQLDDLFIYAKTVS